ncbi:hypothetical protein ACWOAH_10070 [Vagococcus vulneris]|uniref:Uncharacterized protein n=1 Tax=Vagococcus vulneris TaxID=1977869 RepID=A0A429ZUC1_9ENTE|nr:hypothetical protein [Vagococcus vulneris]RST97327.1 hypothetical protein CBF37_10075 [Vagococcus vulneris]
MQDILEFNDCVVSQYGHFSQVELKVVILENNIETTVPISFLSDYSGLSLSMLWSDAGIVDYKQRGLFDLYYATGNNMTFDQTNKSLTILDKSNKEVIVYI